MDLIYPCNDAELWTNESLSGSRSPGPPLRNESSYSVWEWVELVCADGCPGILVGWLSDWNVLKTRVSLPCDSCKFKWMAGLELRLWNSLMNYLTFGLKRCCLCVCVVHLFIFLLFFVTEGADGGREGSRWNCINNDCKYGPCDWEVLRPLLASSRDQIACWCLL